MVLFMNGAPGEISNLPAIADIRFGDLFSTSEIYRVLISLFGEK